MNHLRPTYFFSSKKFPQFQHLTLFKKISSLSTKLCNSKKKFTGKTSHTPFSILCQFIKKNYLKVRSKLTILQFFSFIKVSICKYKHIIFIFCTSFVFYNTMNLLENPKIAKYFFSQLISFSEKRNISRTNVFYYLLIILFCNTKIYPRTTELQLTNKDQHTI